MSNLHPQSRGLPCPECQQPIPVTINDLLLAGKLICPACGLELVIDQRQSANSLSVLKNAIEQLNQAEQTYQAAQYDPPRRSPGRLRRVSRRKSTRRTD